MSDEVEKVDFELVLRVLRNEATEEERRKMPKSIKAKDVPEEHMDEFLSHVTFGGPGENGEISPEMIQEMIRESLPSTDMTIHEQARWLQENELGLLQLAVSYEESGRQGALPPEIKRAFMDIDLAHRYIDRKKLKGLTNEERSRRYSELTGGGIWSPPPRTRPPEAVRDLTLALELEEIQNLREQNSRLRESTGGYGTYSRSNKPTSNAGTKKKHLRNLLEQVDSYDREDLKCILTQANEHGDKLSIDQIKFLLDILQYGRQLGVTD